MFIKDKMKSKVKKKAQMEMMGLAVIVILLVLGILFIVRFVVQEDTTDVKKTFTQTETASNIVNTMLKTTTDCRPFTTISDLLKDCATTQSVTCNDGNDSCTFVNRTIDFILNNTLIAWGNQSFVFRAYDAVDPSRPYTHIQNGPCIGERESKQFIIPLYPGSLIVQMQICSR